MIVFWGALALMQAYMMISLGAAICASDEEHLRVQKPFNGPKFRIQGVVVIVTMLAGFVATLRLIWGLS